MSARNNLPETGEYDEKATESRRAVLGNGVLPASRGGAVIMWLWNVAVPAATGRGSIGYKRAWGLAAFQAFPAGDDVSGVEQLPAGRQRKNPGRERQPGFSCKRRMYGAARGRDMCRTHLHGRYAGRTTYKMGKTAGYCIAPGRKEGTASAERRSMWRRARCRPGRTKRGMHLTV